MIAARQFLKDMIDYQSNGGRLAFLVPPYAARLNCSLKESCENLKNGEGVAFQFRMPSAQSDFGHLVISVPDSSGYLYLKGISSKYFHSPQYNANGYGREFMRRAVLFAYNKGFRGIKTNIIAENSTRFWLGIGMRCDPIPKPDWNAIWTLPGREAWQEKVEADLDLLWNFACTELGRIALRKGGYYGTLDFSCDRQRSCVAKRLMLENRLEG